MQPLPDGTHLIHIGPQKTGSTAIQWAMHRARDTLREHGVVYPGPDPRPREAAEIGLGFGRPQGRARPSRMSAWKSLLEQIQEPGHRLVCVSLEAFGRATDEQAEQVVRELGGSSPHVVAVARRYDSLMPSQWQQRVKAGLKLPYDEWLRAILDEPEHPQARNVWVPHDTVGLVQRWSASLGPENFTLIIADEADRGLLPRTFEAMLGVPQGLLHPTGEGGNHSLSYPTVEVLRQLNVLAKEQGWPRRDYYELVRMGMVPTLVNHPPAKGEQRIPPLPGWARERLVELSDRRIEGLSKLPLRVVGDLEQLRVQPSSAPEDVADPDTWLTIDTAVLALQGTMAASVLRRGRVAKKHRRDVKVVRSRTRERQQQKVGASARLARRTLRRLRRRG